MHMNIFDIDTARQPSGKGDVFSSIVSVILSVHSSGVVSTPY